MKSKISTRVGVALLLVVFNAGAVALVPFMGWDWLTKKSPDIVVAACKSTAKWQTQDANGPTEEIRDGLVGSDFEVVSVLKGGLANKAAITLRSRYKPRQGEEYLMFGRFDQGIYHAYETYRIVPLGMGFPTNMLAGKSLDEQVKLALKYRLQKLDQQLKEGQEEKQRLEQAFGTK